MVTKIHPLIEQAAAFAEAAHNGQVRKYTREPFISHPRRVAETIASVSSDPVCTAAAWLHDTLEDTDTTERDLRDTFGRRVVHLVLEVTEVSRPENGNRKRRKRLDLQHYANASADGQSIKLADVLDNCRTIIPYDPGFAVVYVREASEILKALTMGNRTIASDLAEVIRRYYHNR